MQRQDDTERFQLFHLALACYAYDAMTTYSRSLAELGRLAGSPPNLGNQYHRDAVFNWRRYAKPEYKELLCHDCGNERATSYAKPLCRTCFTALT